MASSIIMNGGNFMRVFKLFPILLLLYGLILVNPFSADAQEEKHGDLVIMGGGFGYEQNQVFEKIVELSGGTNGKIGVLTSASNPSSSESSANKFIGVFESYGIDVEWIPVDLDNKEVADDQSWADRINQGEFTGIMLGGGGQWRHITSLLREDDKGNLVDSLLMESIRNQFEQGDITIAGTSAGAAAMATDEMMNSGDRHISLVNGATPWNFGSFPSDKNQLTYYQNGLKLFDYGLPEQHFSNRGREPRAVRLAADTGQNMVYGMDEKTALIVTDTNTSNVKMEVMGEEGVQIFNLKQASIQDDGKPGNWSIKNVSSTYLTHEDQYLPLTDDVIFANNKENIKQNEQDDFANEPSQKITGGGKQFINAATQLFNAKYNQKVKGYTSDLEHKYQVDFEQTMQSEGVYVDQGDNRIISYHNLKINIKPFQIRDFSANEIKSNIEDLEETENFDNATVVRILTNHLSAVNHFENNEEDEKVLKHMKSFKHLLKVKEESDLISKNAFDILMDNSDLLIQHWQ